MELASMLARERFSDHPKSVCRVLAAFLREYNDAVDDIRRQDLYCCAGAVVGTRASRAVERARLARCAHALSALREADGALTPLLWPQNGCSGRELLAHRLARHLAESAEGHRRALALVGELAAIGRGRSSGTPARRSGQRPRLALGVLALLRDPLGTLRIATQASSEDDRRHDRVDPDLGGAAEIQEHARAVR